VPLLVRSSGSSAPNGDLASPPATYAVYPGADEPQVRRICEQLAHVAGLRIQDPVYGPIPAASQ
jgi:hypothetical protein